MALQKKPLAIAAIIVGAVIFGVGGYYLGTKSMGKPSSTGQQAASSNYSPVISDLQARLNANPKDLDVLMRLGDAYFESKQFGEAATYYKRALEINPDDVEIYNNIGLAVHYQGNSVEGLKYVDEGIKKNPYHQRVLLTKGFILAYGVGDLKGARDAWEKARVLNPDSEIGKAAASFISQMGAK